MWVDLNQPTKLGGVLDLALRLAEDQWGYNRTDIEFVMDAAIVILNFDAV